MARMQAVAGGHHTVFLSRKPPHRHSGVIGQRGDLLDIAAAIQFAIKPNRQHIRRSSSVVLSALSSLSEDESTTSRSYHGSN